MELAQCEPTLGQLQRWARDPPAGTHLEYQVEEPLLQNRLDKVYQAYYIWPVLKNSSGSERSRDWHITSLSKLNVILIIWISAMHMWRCYPIVPSKLSRKSDYCLLLLNNCPVLVDGVEELALLKPFLEKIFTKRSFRNGVGSGIKKTSFQRAKS
ncbi:neuropeptide S [Tiliqua scincoides]|uniref:neuropeptide S n=1 Tax=Tiliqua scincoides TaxID=71010 RepID=UPI00346323A4